MNRWIAIAWIASAALAGAADKIVGGPYVVNVTQRTATVGWVVETAEATLGTSPGGADKKAPLLRAEHINFRGLRPGQTYYYSIPGQEGLTGSFKTPPSGAEPFQFVVYGDNRTRHDVHRKVVGAIMKYAQPDFIVQTGDMVADGGDSSLWPTFFDIEHDLLKKVAFYPALGNHERNDSLYYQFFGPAPYYSFTWGNAHFSVLDSDIGNAASTPSARDAFWSEQVKWLEEDLKAGQKSDFRFVVAHHPPLTAVSYRQGDNPHMTALMPLLEKYKVTAGFFGHDHNYQHYLKNGVHYFVTGGGGAPLYDVDKPPQGITQKVAEIENFMIVKISGKTAHFEAMKTDGETIDITDVKQ